MGSNAKCLSVNPHSDIQTTPMRNLEIKLNSPKAIDSIWGDKLRKMFPMPDGECILCFETFDSQLAYFGIQTIEYSDDTLDQVFLKAKADVIPRSQQMTHAAGQDVSDPVKQIVNQICWDEELKDYFHVGLALRSSGNLDFYVKFRMVEDTNFNF